MAKHRSTVSYTLEGFLKSVGLTTKEEYEAKPWCKGQSYEQLYRYWVKVWKRHVEKHGNVPLVRQCSICSGKAYKRDIKKGVYKESTREEQKDIKEQVKDGESEFFEFKEDDVWGELEYEDPPENGW
jgi:hypothetical protein